MMRAVQPTRCPRLRAACSVLAVLAVLYAPTAAAAPYVSCPGGYIAPKLADCPSLHRHPVGGPRPGGGGGTGVLGNLLDSIGLGGLL